MTVYALSNSLIRSYGRFVDNYSQISQYSSTVYKNVVEHLYVNLSISYFLGCASMHSFVYAVFPYCCYNKGPKETKN